MAKPFTLYVHVMYMRTHPNLHLHRNAKHLVTYNRKLHILHTMSCLCMYSKQRERCHDCLFICLAALSKIALFHIDVITRKVILL